ncbi:DUF2851 family protein [uncultured Pigmentiphaga sp.]|uniref:DUF2851 family protein n=1 Tax=uncultured Pigmentiphaga sp. TaxID=340361 RepID=UPI00261897E3|nr:DUF2851 family protein [uncultured Pigmentiphaga sp.]
MNLSERYSLWLQGSRLKESPPPQLARRPSPLEMQARWFAGEFGTTFALANEEWSMVEIRHFGEWNREHGPTFVNALLSFNGEPPVEGDIEVHPDPLEWDRHAAHSPDYRNTKLIVLGGAGTGGSGMQGIAPASTCDGTPVAQIQVDITALEFGARPEPARPSPCCAPMATLPDTKALQLIEAAAQYRLCRKAARMQALATRFTPGEALYQTLAEALGYRHNKLPFKLLAQRFSLALVRRSPCPPEPLLFAGAGFLPLEDLSAMPDDTRTYLKQLWQQWWPHRTNYERLCLNTTGETLWSFRQTRPVNHPQRRVAALAEMVRNWPVIQSLALDCDVTAIKNFFAQLSHPYWETHYTLTSRPSAQPMALVGESRVVEMLANVFFPAAIGSLPKKWTAYCSLAGWEPSQRVKTAADRLFGPERLPKAFLGRIMVQQGLLQLYEDHCVAGELECSHCTLPDKLEKWIF